MFRLKQILVFDIQLFSVLDLLNVHTVPSAKFVFIYLCRRPVSKSLRVIEITGKRFWTLEYARCSPNVRVCPLIVHGSWLLKQFYSMEAVYESRRHFANHHRIQQRAFDCGTTVTVGRAVDTDSAHRWRRMLYTVIGVSTLWDGNAEKYAFGTETAFVSFSYTRSTSIVL